jgi:preprotein translocase subunit SecE
VSEAVDTLGNNKGGKEGEKRGVGEFIRETREELEKVSYPSSEDVRGTTIIVILNVIFFSVFLYLVDQVWVYVLWGIEWLVNRLAGF